MATNTPESARCVAPHDEETHPPLGTWHVPISNDAGKTHRMVWLCDFHHDRWWDDADWDGRHLETPWKASYSCYPTGLWKGGD